MIKKLLFTLGLLSILMESKATLVDDSWKKYDSTKDRIEALQLSPTLLETTSTEDLLQLCLSFPYNTDLFFYGCNEEGFNLMTTEFNGYAELFSRSDVIPVILDEFPKLTNRIEKTKESDIYYKGNISVNTLILEFIALKNSVYNKMTALQKANCDAQ